MYGKVFTEIFDSSLMAEGGWLSTYIFMCMISFADKQGRVKHDPRTLYRRIGLNVDERVSFNEFLDAVEFLQAEDEHSNLPAARGCRLIPASRCEDMDGNRGWQIVNYVHYRDKGGSIEKRRAADAARKRKEREAKAEVEAGSNAGSSAGSSDPSPERGNNNLEEKTPDCHVTSAHKDIYADVDTLNPSGRESSTDDPFDSWWQVYPKKVKKKDALKIWKRKKPSADILIADTLNRIANDAQWREGFIPHPTTYLNGERWEDELETGAQKLSYAEQLRADMDRQGIV